MGDRPRRDEYSDTMAFVVYGPARELFYCPDIDGWGGWDRDLKGLVSGLDVTLLGGTFYSAGDLPGRDLSRIPHPLATDSAQRLAGADCDVRLVHLNHSNPLYDPGPERAWLAARGLGRAPWATVGGWTDLSGIPSTPSPQRHRNVWLRMAP